MADFGGFQIKTPQEVLAELNAQRAAIAQLPPEQQRTANIQFQIANMFGNPELQKAQKAEDAIKGAERVAARSSQSPGSLEYEAERLGMMFDAVKQYDPAAAAQIQERLVSVREAQFQQQRLKADDARSDKYLDYQGRNIAMNEARAKREAIFDDYTFVRDRHGNAVAFDINDPDRLEAYKNALKEKGAIPLTQPQAFDMLMEDQVKEAMKAEFNKSSLEKKVGTYQANIQYMDKATRLIGLLANNPQSNTSVNGVLQTVANLKTEADAVISALRGPNGEEYSQDATMASIQAKLADMEDLVLPAGMQKADFESAILEMAYVMARRLDSGGRLSDQDVNMAIRMLGGGNVNPKVMTRILLRNALDGYQMTTGADAEVYRGRTDSQSTIVTRLMDRTQSDYQNVLKAAGTILTEEEILQTVDPWAWREKFGGQPPGAPASDPSSGYVPPDDIEF